MNNLPAVIIAVACYMLVVVAGILGILILGDSTSTTPLVTTWLGFAGMSGLMGAILATTKRVESHTSELVNGNLEKRVTTILGQYLAGVAVEKEKQWEQTAPPPSSSDTGGPGSLSSLSPIETPRR